MKPEILVKLKMKKSYKVFLIFISLLIIISIGIGIVYLSFDKIFVKESDIDVKGSLSINYVSGKKIKINGNDKIKFTVTNSSDKSLYYDIELLNIRGNGKYELYNDDKKISDGIIKSTNEETVISINIEGNKTEEYELLINSSESITALLNLRVQDIKTETFANLLLKNNSYGNSLTKPGVEVATEDEGLIKDADDWEKQWISYPEEINIVRIEGELVLSK